MRVRTVLLLRVTSAVDKVDHPQFFDPPYALKSIQAGLQKDQDLAVHLLDCWIRPMGVAALLAHAAGIRPDLIVISSSSFDAQVANEFVASVKKDQHAPLVVGVGQSHYLNRNARDAQERGYDAILLGEPEQEFFQLFGSIRHKGGMGFQPMNHRQDADATESRGQDARATQEQGRDARATVGDDWRQYYWKCYEEGRRFAVENPDHLAFPTYTPQELESYRSIFPVQVPKRVVWGYLIATRGCPHGCVFCSEAGEHRPQDAESVRGERGGGDGALGTPRGEYLLFPGRQLLGGPAVRQSVVRGTRRAKLQDALDGTRARGRAGL